MQNILTSSQMRDADAYTIKHEPISSIDLMERASSAFVNVFAERYPDNKFKIVIICGQGNNGGDGLAIARLLTELGYQSLQVIYLDFSDKQSEDNQTNLERLKQTKVPIQIAFNASEVKLNKAIIIDAILGSGLNKPLQGEIEQVVQKINENKADVISVDVPTGFFAEEELNQDYNGVKADWVITFQLPKINFFFPESAEALQDFEVVDIGLSQEFILQQQTDFKLVSEKDICSLIKPRRQFTHKGAYGHALIAAGAINTMGAALLCAHACLKTGAGLTTLACPKDGLTALNVALPDVMALPSDELNKSNLSKFNAFAVGPGWGVNDRNREFLEIIFKLNKPTVLDADALNILSEKKEMLQKLPSNAILTPHMKEFDRLFGNHENWRNRVETALTKAQELQVVIVLKNQYTFIALPNGEICINQTGNPAMAQGGMGDTLTGIIVSLLAQGYSPEEASIMGVYLHGKAGDELVKNQFVVSASQIAGEIPIVMKAMSSC